MTDLACIQELEKELGISIQQVEQEGLFKDGKLVKEKWEIFRLCLML